MPTIKGPPPEKDAATLLHRARMKSGLSREEVALRVRDLDPGEDLDGATFESYERGERYPSDSSCAALARVLDLDAVELRMAVARDRLGVDDSEREKLREYLDRKPATEQAVLDDPYLTGRQKAALVEVYREMLGRRAGAVGAPQVEEGGTAARPSPRS